MCLIDKKQFRVAEKDIPVFKVVLNKKYSPLRRERLFIRNQSNGNIIPYRFSKNYEFEGNVFYACLSMQRANEWIQQITFIDKRFTPSIHPWEKLSIVKGYIPEGTRYAIDEYENICARKMILNL